jgi:hypothetical protein
MPDLMRARDPDTVRAAMKARGELAHRELAKLADTTMGTIGFILAGRPTSREVAKRIARSLRRPVDVLFVPVTSNDRRSDGEHEAVA